MKYILLISSVLFALAGCDSDSNPTSFDVDIVVLSYGDNPASTANVTFIAPGAAPAAGDTIRFDNVSLPWTYDAKDLGMGRYMLEACVVGQGVLESRLDVNNGYQGFITYGFGNDFTPDDTQGECAFGAFRVSDRTEVPPWEQ